MTKRRKTEGSGYQANSYIIPHDVIKDMDEMIHNTHKTGKEHGMSLCIERGDNKIKSGIKSVGTDTGISISEKCRGKNDRYVGSYHTHPDDSETAPSAQDIFSSCTRISNLDCIGKNERGELVCYAKKDKDSSCTKDAKPLKNIEDMFYDIPYGEMPGLKKELYAEVDRVADKKFNVHKIK